MTDFAWLTVAEAAELIRGKKLSPVEYTRALIALHLGQRGIRDTQQQREEAGARPKAEESPHRATLSFHRQIPCFGG